MVLSTAHPAKFGAAVARATGCTVTLPTGLADLKDSEVPLNPQPSTAYMSRKSPGKLFLASERPLGDFWFKDLIGLEVWEVQGIGLGVEF